MRRLIDLYILALLVYAFGAAMSLLLQLEVSGYTWLVVLHLAGAAVFYFLWKQQRSRDVKFQSFGNILLLSCALFRLFDAMDTAVNGARLEQWNAFIYATSANPEWAIFCGETLTVVGLICVSAAWESAIQDKGINLSLSARAPTLRPILVAVYLSGLAFEVAKRIIGVDFSGLDQLISVFRLGGVAAIFGFVSTIRSVKMRVGFAVVAGMPFAYLAASGLLKEYIIIPFLPAAYFAWTGWTSKLGRASLLSCAFAAFCLLQVYVILTRDLVWIQGQKLSTNQLIETFLAKTDTATLLKGVDRTAARINLTNTHAWTMTIAENVGLLPDEIFGGLATIFVPRLIWPEKPDYNPGLQQTYRVFGYHKDLVSSTAAGFVTELYLGGGLVAAVIGSVGFGFGIGLLQRFVSRISTPLAVQVHNFSLFILALRLDEDHPVYAFSKPLFFVVFLVFCASLWNMVGSLAKTKGLTAGKVPVTGSNPI
jgi:hypothetical protein